MGIYVDILLLLAVLPDVATVLGIEPQTVLVWALRAFLFVMAGLLNGILGWFAVEHLVKPLRDRWHEQAPEVPMEIRERESELNREIGHLEGRRRATEEELQRERAAREKSDRQVERYKAELEKEKRRLWRRLLGR